MKRTHLLVILSAAIGVGGYLCTRGTAASPSGIVQVETSEPASAAVTEKRHRDSARIDSARIDSARIDSARIDSASDDVPSVHDRLPPGEDLIYLSFSHQAPLLRMLEPGDRVDVAALVEENHDADSVRADAWKAEMILQHVAILDVEHGPKSAPQVIRLGLSVTRQEANLLEAAQADAELYLLPRNRHEEEIHAYVGRTIDEARAMRADLQRQRLRRWCYAHPDQIEHVDCPGADADYAEAPEDDTRPDRGPLGQRVPFGERAYLLPTEFPAGIIKRGAWIDIVGRYPVDADQGVATRDTGEHEVTTLLKQVEVLDTIAQDDGDALVISVTAREARLLELTRKFGHLRAALRHPRAPITESLPPSIRLRRSLATTERTLRSSHKIIGCDKHDIDATRVYRGRD